MSFSDPNSTIDDVPENYRTVTYELVEERGQTHFTVKQGDYSTVAEGERRYQEAYNNGEGWRPNLIQIKELVESPKNECDPGFLLVVITPLLRKRTGSRTVVYS